MTRQNAYQNDASCPFRWFDIIFMASDKTMVAQKGSIAVFSAASCSRHMTVASNTSYDVRTFVSNFNRRMILIQTSFFIQDIHSARLPPDQESSSGQVKFYSESQMLAGKVSRDILLGVSKRMLVRCYQFLLT